MNVTELSFFKNFLLNQKGSILNKTLEFKSEELSQSSSTSDDSEAASRNLEMTLSIYLHERDRLALLQIEQALCRIHEGTYGLCGTCDEPIDIRRLQARPLATLCLGCMEDAEGQPPLSH